MTELKECPFCGKKDGLEITWDEWIGVITQPDWYVLKHRPRGQGDILTINCNCGCTLSRCIDGLVGDIEDRIGMDAEITDDMIEDELIRIWNRD